MRTGNYYKKSLWTEEEDIILMDYIKAHGKGHWNQIAKSTGLKRCGKSCRLRWMNYLSPGVKRDNFTEEEEDLIIRLHKLLGNRWSLIAGRVPGRTDNQVKNYWNTHLCKKIGEKKANNKANHVSTNTKLKTMEVNGSPIESNSKPRCSSNNIGDTEFKVIEGTSNVIEVSDTAEPMFLDSFWDSFWVSDNYFDQLNTPGLMKFLDGYSLDLD